MPSDKEIKTRLDRFKRDIEMLAKKISELEQKRRLLYGELLKRKEK